jgi:hypothetical protein
MCVCRLSFLFIPHVPADNSEIISRLAEIVVKDDDAISRITALKVLMLAFKAPARTSTCLFLVLP